MIIRMTRWSALPDTDAESRRLWDDGVGQVWERQEGLERAHLLSRPGTLERMTFSVWRSADDYRRFVASPDLPRVSEAYDHVYDPGGRPKPQEWDVLSNDWNRYA